MDDATATDEVLELDREDTRWAPPEGVTRHSGDPIEPDADFFADPPEQIGQVLSAETTLKAGARPWKLATRVGLAGLSGWVAAMLFHLFVVEDTLFEVLVFVPVAALVAYLMRFSHRCSYVGKLGVARFRCSGNRTRVTKVDVFLFGDAAELRTSQTRHYHNGVYTGTNYNYTWTDDEGRKAFVLSGTYRGEKAPPKPKDPFHLAVMSETAWSMYLFDLSVKELEERGAIRFNLKGGDWIDVGAGFLVISRKGQTERLAAEEIADLSVDQGVVKLKTVDAKEGWFSSTGVYKFGYDTMANFRLFGLAYANLLGVSPRPAVPEEPIDL